MRHGADTGHGLRPESLPRLFEPFYTTKPDGMGMGLSICRSIIAAHVGGCGRPGASRGVRSFSLRSPLTEPPSVKKGRLRCHKRPKSREETPQ